MEKARYTLTEYGFFTAENAVHIIGCAVAITLLRYALNFVIFKVWHSKFACLYEQQTNISSIYKIMIIISNFQRLPIMLEVGKENVEKMPESCWKGLAYICTWIWSIYIMVTRPSLFFNPDCHWSGEIITLQLL